MTLHWWMHWFWVTALLIIHASSGPSLAAPQSEEMQHISVDAEPDRKLTPRQNRALYIPKIPQPTNATDEDERARAEGQYSKTPQPTLQVPNTTEDHTEKSLEITNITTINASIATMEIVHPSIQWTPVNITEVNGTISQNSSVANTTADPYTNLTESQNSTFASRKRNLTRPDFVKDGAGSAAESRIVTEKPLSLETTYSLQTRIPPNIESSRRVIDQGEGGMDTGAIAGISFAALVLAALAGSTAFVLYRRRYLNKPQTLNDKCSNPDSSGYLDDSTIRDNSEEMYSLDNDSFLNSLEAMTIQNYWTDTVKHTKL